MKVILADDVRGLGHRGDTVSVKPGYARNFLLPQRFAYEATGSVDPALLDAGRRIVERAGETWRIPVAFLTSDREEPGWAPDGAATVSSLLAG